MNTLYTVQLQRADLMELESHLAKALRSFLPFTSHSLYFPTADATPQSPQWISRERTLILPLWHEENPLGIFMARGADARTVKRLMPSLEALAAFCMEHLLCVKQSRIDELTGLARMPRLLERMEHDADMVSSYFTGGVSTDQEVPLHKACMGLIVLRCPALDSLASEFGYTFAHQALSDWAKALQQDLPQEILAARSGENECALLLPTATRTSCSKLTEEVMNRVDAVTLIHGPSKRKIRLHSVAGFALYPQDMESTRLSLGMAEQVHAMLQKARHATQMAYERSRYLTKEEKNHVQSRYMAYARVLAHAGIIQEILPFNQIITNIGRQSGAKEGQHFSVWGQKKGSWQRKGDVVLTEVRGRHAMAEILHTHDPAWQLEKGDNLRISPMTMNGSLPTNIVEKHTEPQDHTAAVEENSHTANTTLLSHGDFLRTLHTQFEKQNTFSLALIRLCLHSTEHAHQEQQHAMEKILQLYTQMHDEIYADTVPFSGKGQESLMPALMGRYGETSLIVYHPSQTAVKLDAFYKDFCQKAQEIGLHLAIGLASYPCLQAHKSNMLEYCHKALDFALLLPQPQVGIMGSLAFNVSADQKYSQGDVFGAVEEYKLAILADANNAMAWNSLGVCMAALSRFSEARNHFKEAIKLWKKNSTITVGAQSYPQDPQSELASTLYNLGTACQSLGETRAATKHFKECIEVDKEHYFAHIRLGQLAEQAGKAQQARQYYSQGVALEVKAQNAVAKKAPISSKAASHKNAEASPLKRGCAGMAYRHLARIALQQEKHAEARELLHETLLQNPQDAMALCMLANIYLQGGEDPAMAEMLARKSVGLRPEYAAAWRVLAQSLRALGQEDAALNAEDKAINL